MFRFSYTRIITAGFAALILCGGVLLSLPISSRTGEWTNLLDAIFTATSTTCVTGLIIYDTYTHWSVFGQLVLLTLIQIGGIGFMTIITMFSLFFKRKIGLHERQLLVQATGMMELGGAVRLIKRIVKMSLAIEAIGVVLLAIRFCPQMGFKTGLYNAVFHSVSAFCNAGFDLMGKYGAFSSLTGYSGDVVVCMTIAALIAIGGIGFVVWNDVWTHRLHFRQYGLHAKIVLVVTGILIAGGAVLFFLFEYDGAFAGMDLVERINSAIFQSVSPRTAGFNSVDLTGLTEASIFLTIILMFIGGSSGSTAGGIKTTSLFILVVNAQNTARKTHSMVAFKRRLGDDTIKRAGAIVTIYAFAVAAATLILCTMEPVSFRDALFETVSAIGTVGLTLGITPTFGATAKIVIIILMFAGRVGWITFLLSLSGKHNDPPVERPVEKIMVG
jgi:trk system potassium uptake protein TrkH